MPSNLDNLKCSTDRIHRLSHLVYSIEKKESTTNKLKRYRKNESLPYNRKYVVGFGNEREKEKEKSKKEHEITIEMRLCCIRFVCLCVCL